MSSRLRSLLHIPPSFALGVGLVQSDDSEFCRSALCCSLARGLSPDRNKKSRFCCYARSISISLPFHYPLLHYSRCCRRELDLVSTFDNHKISRNSEPFKKRAG